jgi:hypothetical protein
MVLTMSSKLNAGSTPKFIQRGQTHPIQLGLELLAAQDGHALVRTDVKEVLVLRDQVGGTRFQGGGDDDVVPGIGGHGPVGLAMSRYHLNLRGKIIEESNVSPG